MKIALHHANVHHAYIHHANMHHANMTLGEGRGERSLTDKNGGNEAEKKFSCLWGPASSGCAIQMIGIRRPIPIVSNGIALTTCTPVYIELRSNCEWDLRLSHVKKCHRLSHVESDSLRHSSADFHLKCLGRNVTEVTGKGDFFNSFEWTRIEGEY